METSWAHRRKWVYGIGFVIAVVLLGIYVFRDTIFPTPTCFDKKQNGYETGVDCGGTCSLRCAQDIIPLSVVWAQAVPTSTSTYDLIALISNKNIDNAPHQAVYTFTVYGADGKKFMETKGTTIVPVDGDFPVIKQNVSLPSPSVTVSATISNNIPHYKVLENPTQPTIRVTNTRYEPGTIPRVYATVVNTKRVALRNVPVRAILYSGDGNVFAVGETIIPDLPKESSKEVVFTWRSAFKDAPVKTSIVPILDPFLGSQ